MKKVIDLPESVISELEYLRTKIESMESVMQGIIDTHCYDESDEILDAPLIREYMDSIIPVRLEYNQKKREVENNYIPENDKPFVSIWYMNSLKNTLEYDIPEDDK